MQQMKKKKPSPQVTSSQSAKIKLFFSLFAMASLGLAYVFNENLNLKNDLKLAKAQSCTPTNQHQTASPFHLNSEINCENKEVFEKAPLCPTGKGNIILPRYYPSHTIHIGFEEDISSSGLYLSIINKAFKAEPRIKVIVMVPKGKMESALNEFSSLRNFIQSGDLQVLATPSNYTIWSQDYFEIATNKENGKSSYLDLPYANEAGEHIPTSLALTCNRNLIRQAELGSDEEKENAANYGGNIEALTPKLAVVGSNMHPKQKQVLRSELQQKFIELNVDWLFVGHVDEVISVIPKKDSSNDLCPFDVFYASSGKALEILKEEADAGGESLNINLQAGKSKGKNKPFTLGECFKKTPSKNRMCISLINSNQEYEKIMVSNIQKIRQALIDSDPSCKSVEFIPVPVFFSPKNDQEKYGGDNDQAITMAPNPVNNIIIDESILLPDQNFDFFSSYIRDLIRPYDLKIEYLDGSYVHKFKGGIHCSTNIKHVCNGHSI
jgi:hypothetical protein